MKSLVTIMLVFFLVAPASGQAQLDQKALDELVAACRASHSAGLSIWWNGKPYRTYSFDILGREVASFSAHKSLISLAVGKLVTDKLLATIDTPVHAWYPEWKQGLKKEVTLRHLLNHTSGIEYNPQDPDGWAQLDIIQYALCASLLDTPGHSFEYNDKAVNLLRGLIHKISGQRMDAYIAQAIFAPLGISGYHWLYDSTGTPENLVIEPSEFAKLGQLILNDGKWNNTAVISPEWIKESLAQGQPYVPNCGLLWWRIPEKITYVVDDGLLSEFRSAGVAEAFITKFRALKGSYDNVNIPPANLEKVLGKDWQSELEKELYPHYPRRATWKMSERYIGYKAEGWRGQYVVIYPSKKLVACRMVRDSPSYNAASDEFRDFEQYVYKLVK